MTNSSFASLQQYVVNYAKNLDIGYVQNRYVYFYLKKDYFIVIIRLYFILFLSTNLLLSFVNKLQADIAYLQSGATVTYCPKICPTISWTYSASDCSCSCSVSNCNAQTQAIDYWNCNCAAKTNCALTKASCAADSDKILDYSACQCKAKP